MWHRVWWRILCFFLCFILFVVVSCCLTGIEIHFVVFTSGTHLDISIMRWIAESAGIMSRLFCEWLRCVCDCCSCCGRMTGRRTATCGKTVCFEPKTWDISAYLVTQRYTQHQLVSWWLDYFWGTQWHKKSSSVAICWNKRVFRKRLNSL